MRSFAERDVRRVGVVADEVPMGPDRRNGGGTGTHERIEHEVTDVRVQLDQPLRQLDGEGSWMPDPGRALRRDVPQVGRRFHELVFEDRALGRSVARSPICAGDRAVEPALARNDDSLREIAQDRVRGTLK